jgi:hypothetical protein
MYDLGAAAMFSGPDSAFDGWNLISIPYCGGDDYIGRGKTVTYTSPSTGNDYTVIFNGYVNVQLDADSIKTLFPSPAKLALTGQSSGSTGAECHMQSMVARWPGIPTYLLDQESGPFNPKVSPGIFQAGLTWGTYHNAANGRIVPDTCPWVDRDGAFGESWGFNGIKAANAEFAESHPNIRIGYSDDYQDAGLSFFACYINSYPSGPNPNNSCTWASGCANQNACNAAMTQSLLDAYVHDIGVSNPRFKVFFHNSQCHERFWSEAIELQGNPPGCGYDVMVQGGVNFKDWVRGFMQLPGFTIWNDVL